MKTINNQTFQLKNHYLNSNIDSYSLKIDPWEKEDLSKIYNLEKFPNRERRIPRTLKKFNLIANVAVVTGFLLYERDISKRNRLTYHAETIYEILDSPVKSIKTKISQINRWKRTGEMNQISYDLMATYNKIYHLDPYLLLRILKQHREINIKEKLLKIIQGKELCI